MKRLGLLLVLLLLTPVVRAQDSSFNLTDQPLRIREIHFEALDAFDPSIPEYRSWPFRFLNAVHIKTKDDFLRRELLVQTGDYADDDLLMESERNLRKYNFLGDVSVEKRIVGPGIADLYVHTEDQWTLQFDISAGKSAGYSTYHFNVEESNFLGLGKTLGIGYDQDPERSHYNFLYIDPQFFNSRWNLKSGYQNASDGHTYQADVIRPFYSLDTRWAYGVSADSHTYTQPLYWKKKTAAEIDVDEKTGLFFAARSWGERYDKRKFGFIFDATDTLYPHPARIIYADAANAKEIRKNLQPVAKENYQYGGMFKWDHQRFIEETYLDNFGRIEDLPVGIAFGTVLTYSSDVTARPDFFDLFSMAQYTLQPTKDQYVSVYADFNGHKETTGEVNNVIFNGYAHYYLQMGQFNLGPIHFPRQTFASSLSTTLTHKVDAPFQISLGENEGLRGYTFKSFTGQNRALLNLEDRIFTPLDFRIVAVGLAAFMDAGYVWSSDQHFQLSDFGVSVGFGLRIALKKSQSARVIRVDFAVPLQNSSSDFTTPAAKGYSISVSSGQIITAIGQVPKLFTLF